MYKPLIAIAAALLAVSAHAQPQVKAVHLPAPSKGHYYAPKPTKIEMPKPGITHAFPIFKAAHISPQKYR